MAQRWPSLMNGVALLLLEVRRVRDWECVLRTGRLRRGHLRNSIERLRRHLRQPRGLHLRRLWILPHVLHWKDGVRLRLLLLLELVRRRYGGMPVLIVNLLPLMGQLC